MKIVKVQGGGHNFYLVLLILCIDHAAGTLLGSPASTAFRSAVAHPARLCEAAPSASVWRCIPPPRSTHFRYHPSRLDLRPGTEIRVLTLCVSDRGTMPRHQCASPESRAVIQTRWKLAEPSLSSLSHAILPATRYAQVHTIRSTVVER